MAADDSNAISAASNQSLLWGVYRPNLYFGTRPRLPDSVMTGLMWFGMQDYHGADSTYRQFFRFRNHTFSDVRLRSRLVAGNVEYLLVTSILFK